MIVTTQTSLVYTLLVLSGSEKYSALRPGAVLSHLVVVLAAETCVGLTNAWILRKSNSLEDRSTRVGASFAMSFVAQVRRFRLITY